MTLDVRDNLDRKCRSLRNAAVGECSRGPYGDCRPARTDAGFVVPCPLPVGPSIGIQAVATRRRLATRSATPRRNRVGLRLTRTRRKSREGSRSATAHHRSPANVGIPQACSTDVAGKLTRTLRQTSLATTSSFVCRFHRFHARWVVGRVWAQARLSLAVSPSPGWVAIRRGPYELECCPRNVTPMNGGYLMTR